MRCQPTPKAKRNDDVQTPPWLARLVVDHFRPIGEVLEPCCGAGNFVRELDRVAAICWRMDIQTGSDFLAWEKPELVNPSWIITNPPWSNIRAFLAKSMEIADDVVFLMTVNHVFTKARVREADAAGFGLKEIAYVPFPSKAEGWPQMGFQLGAIHWRRGYAGPCAITQLEK